MQEESVRNRPSIEQEVAKDQEVRLNHRFKERRNALLKSSLFETIVKRLGQSIPVLLGVSFITFCLMNLLPGDAVAALTGAYASKQEEIAMRARLHLNLPFFDRYIHWLGSALTGHLGESFASGTAVTTIIAQRLPITLELIIGSVLISVLLAVPVSLLAAHKPRAVLDRLNIVVCMTGYSIPNFVLALLLILVFAVHLRLVPALGFVPLTQSIGGNIHSMILPCVALGFAHFSGYSRLLRADLIDQLQGQDYIVTARAKGLTESAVLIRHALRNSLFILLTVIGLNLGTAVGGTVILEQIFALPGIGQELIQAIGNRDVPVVEGLVVLISCAVVAANLGVDLVYALLDPRVRYGRSSS